MYSHSPLKSFSRRVLCAAVTTALLAPFPLMAQSTSRSGGAATSAEAGSRNRDQDLALISRQLPQGKTIATASTAELVEAVRQAILANPRLAAEIAGAIATVTTSAQINAIAEGIGKLFRTHPAIRAQSAAIALALATGITQKGLSIEAAARSSGEVASTLIAHLDPSQQEQRDMVLILVKGVVGVDTHIDYGHTVLEIVLRTVGAMGFPDHFVGNLYTTLRGGVTDPSALRMLDHLFAQITGNSHHVMPGMVISPESNTMNL